MSQRMRVLMVLNNSSELLLTTNANSWPKHHSIRWAEACKWAMHLGQLHSWRERKLHGTTYVIAPNDWWNASLRATWNGMVLYQSEGPTALMGNKLLGCLLQIWALVSILLIFTKHLPVELEIGWVMNSSGQGVKAMLLWGNAGDKAWKKTAKRQAQEGRGSGIPATHVNFITTYCPPGAWLMAGLLVAGSFKLCDTAALQAP